MMSVINVTDPAIGRETALMTGMAGGDHSRPEGKYSF